jgi:GMP synthase-like glutamine amidotransferase
MKIHILEHAPFEKGANIETWAKEKSFSTSHTYLLDEQIRLPSLDNFDALVIMGGPMGVSDENRYPWLIAEKKLIESAITAKKKVLGVCLGAQLIASVLGAKVYANKYKEIGWYPVEIISDKAPFAETFPNPLLAFHWHGDTFDLPNGAKHIWRSPVCQNQAFLWSDNVLALQFHIEVQPENVRDFVTHMRKELSEGGPFVQRAESILADSGKALALRPVLDIVLDAFLLTQIVGVSA